MPKTKHGSTVSFYLHFEQDEYVRKRAAETGRSISGVINEMLLAAIKQEQNLLTPERLEELLPPDDPFSEFEAAFALAQDYSDNAPVTISGCAKSWSWSRRRVRKLLEALEVEIIFMGNERKGYIRKTAQKSD